MKSRRLLNVLGLVGLSLSLVPSSAAAHVTLSPQQSQRGVVERYTVRVPAEGSVATTAVEIEVPAEVTSIWIVAPIGYTYEVVREKDRISRIIWKLDIKPGEVGEFAMYVVNPAVDTMTWRAHQRLADGTLVEWIGTPEDRRPAAVVTLGPEKPDPMAGMRRNH